MSEIKVNEAGFLLDRSKWSEDVMYVLADMNGITMDDKVVELVELVRDEYIKRGTVPPLREFSKLTGGDRKGTHLNKIFNGGPMKKLALIAGLPQPTGCV